MKAVILGNGDILDYAGIRQKIGDYDLLICADGGLRHAQNLGLVPDILLGDMDSVKSVPDGMQTKVFPVRKDETDGEIAVQYALSEGAEEIVMVGFSGCRLDHTLTNIYFLKMIADAGKSGVFLDDKNEIYCLTKKVTLTGRAGDLVSIVPICDMAGVTTDGLEYPLQGEAMYFGKSRGVSNVMTGDMCTITTESGFGLVMKSRD